AWNRLGTEHRMYDIQIDEVRAFARGLTDDSAEPSAVEADFVFADERHHLAIGPGNCHTDPARLHPAAKGHEFRISHVRIVVIVPGTGQVDALGGEVEVEEEADRAAPVVLVNEAEEAAEVQGVAGGEGVVGIEVVALKDLAGVDQGVQQATLASAIQAEQQG